MASATGMWFTPAQVAMLDGNEIALKLQREMFIRWDREEAERYQVPNPLKRKRSRTPNPRREKLQLFQMGNVDPTAPETLTFTRSCSSGVDLSWEPDFESLKSRKVAEVESQTGPVKYPLPTRSAFRKKPGSETPSSTNQSTAFNRFPRNVRDLIYQLVSVSDKPIIIRTNKKTGPQGRLLPVELNLLRTSKSIREEGAEFFYGANTFVITDLLRRHPEMLKKFASRPGAKHVNLVHINITSVYGDVLPAAQNKSGIKSTIQVRLKLRYRKGPGTPFSIVLPDHPPHSQKLWMYTKTPGEICSCHIAKKLAQFRTALEGGTITLAPGENPLIKFLFEFLKKPFEKRVKRWVCLKCGQDNDPVNTLGQPGIPHDFMQLNNANKRKALLNVHEKNRQDEEDSDDN